MVDTKVTPSKAPRVLELIIGIAATAACLAILYLGLAGSITAELVLWGSAILVATSVGGLLVFIVASITGGITRYR